MQASPSRVDVVVPCYNYAHYLEACVQSILGQQGVEVRVLIIDDASPDDTAQVAERLARRDPRVEFHRHAVNRGHIATYNEGLLGWARAEYSLMLSADDMLAPGALRRATELMDRHPEVGMTYGRALTVSADSGPRLRDDGETGDWRILDSERFLRFCCLSGNPVPAPTAVVRTALQQRLGGYRAELPHSGDMEMWMRFATQASVGVFRAVQADYRWHDKNMSVRYYDGLLSDRRERMQACRQVHAQWGAHFPEFGAWLDAMSRRLGEEAFWLASQAFDAGALNEVPACLRFAREHHPALRRTGAWRRFRAKTLLGPALWQSVRPAVNRLRGRPAQAPNGTGPAAPFRIGEQTGWWPRDGAMPIAAPALVTPAAPTTTAAIPRPAPQPDRPDARPAA